MPHISEHVLSDNRATRKDTNSTHVVASGNVAIGDHSLKAMILACSQTAVRSKLRLAGVFKTRMWFVLDQHF